MVFLLLCVNHGHEQERVDVDRAMEFEQGGEPVLHCVGECEVFGPLEVFVVEETAGGFCGSVEEE